MVIELSEYVIDAIADAVVKKMPKRTGHWIDHFDDLFPEESTIECSECRQHQPITICDSYCPNCGAKMESEV